MEPTRTLMSLSRGGADATVVREFDLTTKSFVEGGFSLPEAKSRCSWQSRDMLLVGTAFDDGSLTDSGYPRVVKVRACSQPCSRPRLRSGYCVRGEVAECCPPLECTMAQCCS